MVDLSKKYWEGAHEFYTKSGWIKKPTIFATQVIDYVGNEGKLLDLGAGQGQDSRFFAEKGFEVSSMDFSDTAVSTARSEAKAQELDIEIRQGNLSKPFPFEDETFDVVYSHLALHYFDHQTTKKLFKEIHRVLNKGGIFATLLNTIDDPEIKELDYNELAPGFFEVPGGITKRYFSLEYLETVRSGLFESILVDAHGESHKDEIKILIRFIGKK